MQEPSGSKPESDLCYSDCLKEKPPSLIGGTAIVVGTAVGAGMFSLPVVSAGMWFGWSLSLLLITWFCTFHSSLFILEINLNFQAGASFDTFVKQTLGSIANFVNTLTLCFVLYILTYAYISGGSSIIVHSLSKHNIELPQALAGLLFSIGLACIVWLSTAWVGRIVTILVSALMLTIVLSISGLLIEVDPTSLRSASPDYAIYMFAAIPYFLTSFAYHGNVPSLVKFYSGNYQRVRTCMLVGSLATLTIYTLWNISTMGNIPRELFPGIIAAGGNIGDLVTTLSGVVNTSQLAYLLKLFASIAVISSFLGVSLGLFDFIADKFKFADNGIGRFKTALITFMPPTLGGVLFPNGFIYAIGMAGLCACIVAVIIPALAVRKSRTQFKHQTYRVWGGNVLNLLVLAYGLLVAACFILAAFSMLPIFS